MIRRRLRFVVILLAVASVLAVSTGSSTSVGGARGLDLDVVDDDEDGYLGIKQQFAIYPDGRTSATISLTNRFPDQTRLDVVRVTVAGETRSLLSSDTLDIGETAATTFDDVTCGEPVTIEVEGDGVSVQAIRQVTCPN